MKSPKVFCLGFQKTGTTSLKNFLSCMGYHVAGYHQMRDMEGSPINNEVLVRRAISEMANFDCAQDTPWNFLYKELDEAFPGSKFIHVVRDKDKWIKSAVRDFASNTNTFHDWMYGSPYPLGNERQWMKVYEKHNIMVKDYFSARSQDYLYLTLEDLARNCHEIVRFLDYRGTPPAWPHSNSGVSKEVSKLQKRFELKIRNILK